MKCVFSCDGYSGMAVAVGEQPIKGLVSPEAQARMTVCEALSNLSFAALSRYPCIPIFRLLYMNVYAMRYEV